MNQRIFTSLIVGFRSACAPETDVFVKFDGCHVLFVDIGSQGPVEFQRMLDQSAADTPKFVLWINEQSLHVTILQQHESDCAITLINCQPERRTRKK